ncbi:MAG: restriction endonuclease subunit S [Verrucomicrobia bacterium]|nr:restriction endonuclease subunit S [Verrucomicrobiota bacterium]MCH8512940.1 restriction endonuclease subunit S [Kiritimatiellia bacterium]
MSLQRNIKYPSKKLADLASLSMGYSFRGRIETTPHEDLAVVQMKDLTEDNRVSLEEAVFVIHHLYSEAHMLRKGDLVFRSRGLSPTAALVEEEIEEALLAAPLIRIRPGDGILPAYLRWAVNMEASQAFLKAHARGTGTKMVNKAALAELEIPVPPLARQEEIVALNELGHREQIVLHQIANKRKHLLDHQVSCHA